MKLYISRDIFHPQIPFVNKRHGVCGEVAVSMFQCSDFCSCMIIILNKLFLFNLQLAQIEVFLNRIVERIIDKVTSLYAALTTINAIGS